MRRAALWLAICLVLPVVAGAQETVNGADDLEVMRQNAERFVPVKVLGMQVWIDPETGVMRPPTAEESAKLAHQMKRLFAGGREDLAGGEPQMQTTQSANGTVMVELDTSHLDFAVAHVDEAGELEFGCVDHAHEAIAFAEHGSAAAAAEEN